MKIINLPDTICTFTKKIFSRLLFVTQVLASSREYSGGGGGGAELGIFLSKLELGVEWSGAVEGLNYVFLGGSRAPPAWLAVFPQ